MALSRWFHYCEWTTWRISKDVREDVTGAWKTVMFIVVYVNSCHKQDDDFVMSYEPVKSVANMGSGQKMVRVREQTTNQGMVRSIAKTAFNKNTYGVRQ